jgi:hypothetical protein
VGKICKATEALISAKEERPATMLLMGFGLVGFGAARRKFK